MKDYTYTKILRDEKIMRVEKTGAFDELSNEELERLFYICNIKNLKETQKVKNMIAVIAFVLAMGFLLHRVLPYIVR